MADALRGVIRETCLSENCDADNCQEHAPDLAALVREWEEFADPQPILIEVPDIPDTALELCLLGILEDVAARAGGPGDSE